MNGMHGCVKLLLALMTVLLAGCASEAQAPAKEAEPLQLSCYQAEWQAETVPVVYKRGGPQVWEKYDFMPPIGPVACR